MFSVILAAVISMFLASSLSYAITYLVRSGFSWPLPNVVGSSSLIFNVGAAFWLDNR